MKKLEKMEKFSVAWDRRYAKLLNECYFSCIDLLKKYKVKKKKRRTKK